MEIHIPEWYLQKEQSPYVLGGWMMKGTQKATYSNPRKLHWLADVECHVCAAEVNSWDKRCSRALGYRHIVCEGCISSEYDVTVPELRKTMQEHFGLLPCPGI